MKEFRIPCNGELRVVRNGSVFKASLHGRSAVASCSVEVVDEHALRETRRETVFSHNPGYCERIDDVVVMQNGLMVRIEGYGRRHWVRFSFQPDA